MPRIALFDKKEPVMVGEKAVCQCGLSDDFPFCTGKHQETADEDPMKVYQYVEGERVVIGELHHRHEGCACEHDEGHDCCGKGDGSCKDEDDDHQCACGQ